MRLPAVAVAAALALMLAGAAPGGPPSQGWIVFDDFVAPGEYIHLFRVRPDGSGRPYRSWTTASFAPRPGRYCAFRIGLRY